MPLIDLGGLNTGGLYLDKARYDLPPHFFTAGYDIDFTERGVEPAIAEMSVLLPLLANALHMVYNRGVTPPSLLYLGSDKAYIIQGGKQTEATREGASYSGTDLTVIWDSTFFNGLWVATNGADIPQVWDGKGRLTNLPNFSGINNSPAIIRSLSNILITCGYKEKEGNIFGPHHIFWSDIADPGTLPSNWDYADPASKSGFFTLSDAGGKILSAEVLGVELMVYREQSVYALRYVGGGYIFQSELRFDAYGILGRHTVVNIGRQHFCIDKSKFYIHNGVSAQDIGVGVVTAYFFNDVNPEATDKIFLLHEEDTQRVSIYYPSRGQGMCNRVLIYYYKKNMWTIRTTDPISCGTLVDLEAVDSIWDQDTLTWAEDLQTWLSDLSAWNTVVDWDTADSADVWDVPTSATPERRILLGKYIGTPGKYSPLTGLSSSEGVSWVGNSAYPPPYGIPYEGVRKGGYLERLNLAIFGKDSQGQYSVDRTLTKHLTEAFVEAEYGVFEIRFGVQETHNGEVYWDNWLEFNPDVEYKLDPNMSGRFLAYAVRSIPSAVNRWVMNGLGLEIKPGGRY